MAWTKLAAINELPPGELIEVEHNNDLYALCNSGGEVRAFSGVCPHNGGPLGQGTLHGNIVVCPWHTWEFDTSTGTCIFNDDIRIPVFPVRIEKNEVLVDLPGA